MIALIDADLVAYRSAASCEPTRIKPDREAREVAILRADELMRRILHETGAESYRAFIGGEDNFRYKIYPEYKANRTDKPKPEYLQDVRAFLVSEWNAEIVNGMEADDAMAIAQTKELYYSDEPETMGELIPDQCSSIICSIDKDLLQTAGWHYNFVRLERQFVDELAGLKHFYTQLILGDQSDNIPGYDGKMRPKVPQFLQPCIDSIWRSTDEYEMFSIVLEMYGGDTERLHRNALLLYILRHESDEWRPPVNAATN